MAAVLGIVRTWYLPYAVWFDILTVILWPSSIYLAILSRREPVQVHVGVWSIAVFFNPLIYGFTGWVIWRLTHRANSSQRR